MCGCAVACFAHPGYECWIDNNKLKSITRHGKLPEKNCSTPCSGDPFETCGGNRAFKLYEILYDTPAVTAASNHRRVLRA